VKSRFILVQVWGVLYKWPFVLKEKIMVVHEAGTRVRGATTEEIRESQKYVSASERAALSERALREAKQAIDDVRTGEARKEPAMIVYEGTHPRFVPVSVGEKMKYDHWMAQDPRPVVKQGVSVRAAFGIALIAAAAGAYAATHVGHEKQPAPVKTAPAKTSAP
jgi:hypothetical protein